MAPRGPSKRGPKPPSKNALVWGTVFLVAGAILLSLGGWVWKLGFDTTRWPQVPAEILDARVSASEDLQKDSRHPTTRQTLSLTVAYQYEVGGQTYVGGGLERGTLGSNDIKPVRDRWGMLNPGQKVSVAVNPADPREAYLAPGVSRLAYILGGPGLALAFIGLMFFGAYRNSRQLYRARVEPSAD